jgi:hypothetical protein
MAADTIAIELSKDDALVLLEFSTRFTNEKALTVKDPGDRAALWHLCAALEKALAEPFANNYEDILAAARARLAQDEL